MCSIGTGDTGIPVRIRPAEPKDYANVLRLGRAEFGYVKNPPTFFAERMKKGYFFVAEIDGKFAGFVDMEQVDEYEAQILGLAVVPKYRRKGIGSALLSFALRFLKATGFRCVSLLSRKDNNAANALYRKYGFIPEKEENGIITWKKNL